MITQPAARYLHPIPSKQSSLTFNLLLTITMSLKQFSTRLEISFWNLTIDLLTESPIIQKMVKWVYDHFTLNEWHLFANLDASHALRWASAGLGFGLAAGLLATLF